MPFLGGRGQASRGYFGRGITPDAPTLGTLTTSISSPGTVSKPTKTEDDNNATFTWDAVSAGGVTIGIPFTAPANNGGLVITDYEYSTDNGSTWKSAGSTTSPISITTVSASASNLSPAVEYTVKLRAVNPLGSGTASSGSAKTTLAAVTSYTIRVYNNRGTETLTETVTGNTTRTYTRSQYRTATDWSVTVAAVNENGTGTYSTESDASTGWTLASCTNYNATGCDSCGTKSTVCSKWTRGVTEGPCDVSCGTESGCSDSWTDATVAGTYNYPGHGMQAFTIREDAFDFFGDGIYMSMDNDPQGIIVHGVNCGGNGNYYVYNREYCSITNTYRIVPYGCIDTVFAK